MTNVIYLIIFIQPVSMEPDSLSQATLCPPPALRWGRLTSFRHWEGAAPCD